MKRGVKVVVLTPGIGDHATVYAASRGGFGPFLLGGVEIYEYQTALMHAKAMVVDGVWANVGSANLDNRSLAINEEVNLLLSMTPHSLDSSRNRFRKILSIPKN